MVAKRCYLKGLEVLGFKEYKGPLLEQTFQVQISCVNQTNLSLDVQLQSYYYTKNSHILTHQPMCCYIKKIQL